MLKFSQHEDFGIPLTLRWFGDVFLSMRMQNSAILADPILTFYKVGRVLLVAKRPLTPHHKTHNTAINMSRRHPTPSGLSLSSMSWSAVPPNHGAAASFRLAQLARHWVTWCRS
jgi:hypothetical protein